MFGQKVWRPAAVAVVMSAAAFLPQGVAVAATPGTIDTVTCSQVSAELREGALNCTPLRHEGVDGVFIGPVPPSTSPAGGSTSGSATTGGATTGDSGSTPTTTPTTENPSDGGTGGTGGTGGNSGGDDDAGSSGGSGSGSSDDSGDDSDDDADDNSSSGSGSSGSSGSSDDDSSGSSSGSSSGGSSYSTNSGVTLGAAACPAGVGGTGATTATATGSVDTSAATSNTTTQNSTNIDTSGVASLTDVTGGVENPWGIVTNNNVTASAGSALASVAGSTTTAGAAIAGNANLPADVIDLSYWYLTLPTGNEGSPDTIENPNLAKFTNEFFKLNNSRDGVVFSARADGVTTENSSYPRSELREMNGSEKASWSNTSGSHTLDVCEAITKTPSAKPEVVAAQIHDGGDDVMQIRLEGKTLMVQYNDGKSEIVIDPNYVLGTPYNVRIIAENSKVDVLYNGQKKAELPLSGSGWYWKVGAYVQSSTDKGESPDATGEVTVYSIKCVHT
jgi:hypothetical protein